MTGRSIKRARLFSYVFALFSAIILFNAFYDHQFIEWWVHREEAERQLLKRAALGEVDAERTLGRIYVEEDRDNAKGEIWLLKAAEQGDSSSAKALGMLFAEGKGMPQDWGKSYFWSCVAVKCFQTPPETHHPGSLLTLVSDGPFWRNFDPYASVPQLTAEEMRLLEKSAAEWKPTPTYFDSQAFSLWIHSF